MSDLIRNKQLTVETMRDLQSFQNNCDILDVSRKYLGRDHITYISVAPQFYQITYCNFSNTVLTYDILCSTLY